jgi:hypothetical protein
VVLISNTKARQIKVNRLRLSLVSTRKRHRRNPFRNHNSL